MSTKTIEKSISASEYFNKKFGPLTLGRVINTLRTSEEISQTDFAKKLGISRANLCDIEKERKLVSPERAIKFAKKLNHSEELFLQIALNDLLRKNKIKYQIELKKIA